jgi:hypothetical protein
MLGKRRRRTRLGRLGTLGMLGKRRWKMRLTRRRRR